MQIGHYFRVSGGLAPRETPTLGRKDIEKLIELFPGNPVWDVRTNGNGNIRFVTVGQAKALYDDMVEYYATHEVSDELYDVIDHPHVTPIMSSLRWVFHQYLDHFEKHLGFSCAPALKEAVAAKREEWMSTTSRQRQRRRAGGEEAAAA
jgi:hypothetical protein